MTTPEQTIVVGLDGSDIAAEALDWAMAEAEHRGHSVEVITVWRYFQPLDDPASAAGTGAVAGADVVKPHPGLAELAEAIDEHVAAVAKRHPTVRYRHLQLGGRAPGETLVEAASGATMLVVGSHGVSGVLPALLGSVSAYCIRHARCPVVIIRAGRETGRRAGTSSRAAEISTMGPLL